MAAYQVIKELNVDVAKRNLFQAIVAKQYDRNTRFLKITLMNEGNPIIVGTDSFVTINARRADETSGAFAGSVNDDGSITVPLSPWMLQLDDTVKCDVSIIDPASNDKLTSISFDIEVERAAHGNDDITEDENYDILISLIADVSTAIDAANEAADRANAAAGGGGSSGGTIVVDDTDYYKVDLSQYSLVQGTISTTGADTDSNTKRCKMRYPVFVYAGTKVKFENDDTDKSATLHIYDLSTNSSGYSWTECVTDISEYTADRDCYIRLVFLNGNDNITDNTYAEMLSSISILSPLPPLQQVEGEPMSYFAQEIRDVSKKVGAETGLKLSVITDAHCYFPRYGNKNHLSYTHFRNVKAVADNTHVDAIVNLGDNTFGYSYGDVSRDIHAMLSKWSKSLSAPYLQADGNHDENHYYAFASTRRYNQLITPQELASYYHHQNDDNQRSYFYHDIPEQHTRIIVLNANDAYVLDDDGNPKYNKEETNAIAVTYAYMPQQVEWLANLLHDTEKKCAGWDVIVCSHQSVCPTGSGSTQVPKNTEVVWGLLTAFNGGTTYAKDVTDGDFSVSVNETYEGKCQIPCALHGHKHYDRAFKENGIWNICIAASVCISSETSDEGATVPERTPYTATEDAWDICCIDADSIKMVRFGAGEDRAFTRDKTKFEVVESGGTEGGIKIEGATVGQVAKIAAVDDNGVPTAWEPVDMPSGGGEEWELIEESNNVEVRSFRHDYTGEYKRYVILINGRALGTNATWFLRRLTSLQVSISTYLSATVPTHAYGGGTWFHIELPTDNCPVMLYASDSTTAGNGVANLKQAFLGSNLNVSDFFGFALEPSDTSIEYDNLTIKVWGCK